MNCPTCHPVAQGSRKEGRYIFHSLDPHLVPQRTQLTLREEMKIHARKANISVSPRSRHLPFPCTRHRPWALHSILATAHFNMGTPRCRKAKRLAAGHRASEWQVWDLNQAAWIQLLCRPTNRSCFSRNSQMRCQGEGSHIPGPCLPSLHSSFVEL